MPPSILVICGPTCSGKGDLARKLAERLDGEIVSADSRKIYRRFDIGTAKPCPAVRQQIPHHLIDICDPEEVFSAARFVELASRAIAEIGRRRRMPVVVGGTGLYLRALLHGIIDTPPRNENLRDELLGLEANEPGVLYRMLQGVDPSAALQIPATDLVRMVRALEVHTLTGRPLSSLQDSHRFRPQRYHAFQVAPDWPRDKLYQRIEQRVDGMVRAGWLEEAIALKHSGLDRCPAFQTVGYLQLKDHLDEKLSLEEAVRRIKKEHRRYAKRQLVWFKAVPGLRWIPAPVDLDGLTEEARRFFGRGEPKNR